MVHKWLSYLLITLIALQSVAAIADTHQAHQTGTVHIEFEHEHDSLTPDRKRMFAEETGVPSIVKFDCHHCCHCHNIAQFIIGNSNEYPGMSQFGLGTPEYRFPYISHLISPDLRPPII